MIVFVLLICLIFCTGIAIILCNGDVMEPLALSFESYAVSVFIAFCHNGFFKMDISLDTVVILLTALFIYMMGYLIVKGVLQGNGWLRYTGKERIFYYPNKKVTYVFLIIEIFGTFRMFQNTLSVARGINESAGFSNMLYFARNAYLFTEESMGVFDAILSFYVTAISFFYTYIVVHYVVNLEKFSVKKLVNCKIELIMILMSLFSDMLRTGRTFLIKYIVFLFIIFYYQQFAKKKVRVISFSKMLKIVKYILYALVIFFALFQLMGILTQKTGTLNPFDMLYGYSGAAVIALDKAIDMYQYDGRFFGEESFYGLYGFLNTFGFDIPNDILHLPFVEIGEGQRTNIYTAIRTYLYDFGYIGMYMVQFLMGMSSACMYSFIYRFEGNLIYMFVYGILIYGTAMQGIEEITLRNFMSVTNVMCVFFLVIFMFVTQRKFKVR